MRGGGEFGEVPVAGLVLRQQHEVMVNVLPAAGGLLVETAAGRNINLAADNRLDAPVARGLIKINCAAEHAVVGDRERGELQFAGFVHQPIEAAGAIEQRILRVQMQMDKIRVRHGVNLTPAGNDAQAKRRGELRLTIDD